jgi:hypothetical protein
MLSSKNLASAGQFLIHAQQRMHRSISVVTLSLIEMAAVGHTLAQVPQTVQESSWVSGETVIDLAPLASYGNLPGTTKTNIGGYASRRGWEL